MQNQFFQRYNQGQTNLENVDQGTWQQPGQMQQQLQQQQMQVQQQGQMQVQQQSQMPEDTYFTGTTGSAPTYYTNQQSTGTTNTGGMSPGFPSNTGGMSPGFPSNMGNFNKGLGNKGMQGSTAGNNTLSQSQNNASYMSNQMNLQDKSGGKMSQSSTEDVDTGYYGFPNESYMTSTGANMMDMNAGNSMGMTGGMNAMNMGGSNNSMNMVNTNNTMSMGNTNNGAMGMGNSGNYNMNMMGNYQTENMNMNNMMMNDGSMGMDNSSNFGNNQFQNQVMAAAFGNWQNNANGGNNPGFNNARGHFPRRGRRGRGFNQYKGADMFYQDGNMMGGQQYGGHDGGRNNLDIRLNATNHNHWCFLRKSFNKRDNDLVEHLFDIHEKFCHHCKDRLEERKVGKKRKYEEETKEPEPQPEEEEEPEEELTEEELEMRKLMGFSGFKSTKGSKVKDNNYTTVSSVNNAGSNEAVDETTTLTEAEKKMIASIGGFSVFTKTEGGSSSKPGFGAPAVTFDPIEGSGPGYSNEPLFDKDSESKEEEKS